MKDYSKIWNQVLDTLEIELESDTFTEIFKPCSYHEFKNGYIVVLTPSEYIKNRLNKLYIHLVNDIISHLITEELVKIKIH